MGKLIAPNGAEIIGTLERLVGRADLDGALRLPDGTFEIAYAGHTKVFWDDQVTVTREGQRVFLDEDGNEYLERELTLVDDIPDDDDEAEA